MSGPSEFPPDAQAVAEQLRAQAERVAQQVRDVAEEATSAFILRFKQVVADELAKHPEAVAEVKRVLRDVQETFSDRR